jgi:hypothetical protein
MTVAGAIVGILLFALIIWLSRLGYNATMWILMAMFYVMIFGLCLALGNMLYLAVRGVQ